MIEPPWEKQRLPLSAQQFKDLFGSQLIVHGRFERDVGEHLLLLRLVPRTILKRLKAAGLKIVVGSQPVAKLPEGAHLAGLPMRGHPQGVTWDQGVGAYLRREKTAIIGVVDRFQPGVGSHEVGHAIGDLLGFNRDPRLTAHHVRLHPRLAPYMQQGGPGGEAGCEELLAIGIEAVLEASDQARKLFDEEFVTYIETQVLCP
jgi:hypothetical protein